MSECQHFVRLDACGKRSLWSLRDDTSFCAVLSNDARIFVRHITKALRIHKCRALRECGWYAWLTQGRSVVRENATRLNCGWYARAEVSKGAAAISVDFAERIAAAFYGRDLFDRAHVLARDVHATLKLLSGGTTIVLGEGDGGKDERDQHSHFLHDYDHSLFYRHSRRRRAIHNNDNEGVQQK